MVKIDKIFAYWVLDSRGKPTVACKAYSGNYTSLAMVPSGASTGSREALELRDNNGQFLGFGVRKAVDNVNNILVPEIINFDLSNLPAIDQRMIDIDGTENKSRLGANAILSVSLAIAKIGALVNGIPLYEYLAKLYGFDLKYILPVPYMNIVNGGAHAKNGLDFQEFMIVPLGAKKFSESIRMGAEVYLTLGKMIKASGVGDEGGYSPTIFKSEMGTDRVKETIELIINAITVAGYKPGTDISLALDVAASEFFQEGNYVMKGNQKFSTKQVIQFYQELTSNYPVFSIEDGLAESDYDGWGELTQVLGDKIDIVGDDLFTTNQKSLLIGIEKKLANAVIVKVNQIGTLTETVNFIKTAQSHSFKSIISHRSGETEDTTIADLALAFNSGRIKTGSLARSERTAKYNRLIEIENELGAKLKYGNS